MGQAVSHRSRVSVLPGVAVLLRPEWFSVPASPGGRCHLRWGVVCGSPWVAVSPPPCSFFPPFPVVNLLSVQGGGCRLVAWWSVPPAHCPAPPPLRMLPFFSRPLGRWSASFLAAVCACVSGVSLPLDFRRLRGCRGLLCLACRRPAGRGSLLVCYCWVLWALPMVSPGGGGGGGGVVRLGVGSARLRGCVAVPPAFLRSPWVAGVRLWGGEGRSAVSYS